jgi:hypothetical protein
MIIVPLQQHRRSMMDSRRRKDSSRRRDDTKPKWFSILSSIFAGGSILYALLLIAFTFGVAGVVALLLGSTTSKGSTSSVVGIFRYYSIEVFDPPPPLKLAPTDRISSANDGAFTFQLLLNEPPISRIHCLADTFSDTPHAAIFRSCRYDNLCYHTQAKRFVEYPSGEHWNLRSMIHPNIHLSSVPKEVMLSPVSNTGTTDPGSASDGITLWAPQSKNRRQLGATPGSNSSAAINESSQHEFYMMDGDDNILWIPIQLCLDSAGEMAHGQILFDVYLPIYTLLEIFDLRDRRVMLILMGDKIEGGTNACLESVYKLADMMAISRSDIVSVHDLHTILRPVLPTQTNMRLDVVEGVSYNNTNPVLVCNKISVAGIGAYASHGVPQSIANILSVSTLKGVPPTSIRRASNLRGFRKYLLSNMKMADPERSNLYRVVFSSSVSLEILQYVQKSVPDIRVSQMPVNFTVYDQIEVLSNATIFVCSLREDKPGAFFLPDGAVIIMMREPDRRGSTGDNVDLATHWNFWNNNALVRTHLLDGRNFSQDVLAVEYLIRDELDRLRIDAEVVTSVANEPVAFGGRLATLVHASPPTTQVHCLGEKIFPHRHGAEKYRSCHFENLCFDLESKSFVEFPSQYSELLRSLNSNKNHFSSIPKQMHGIPNGFPPAASRVNVSSYYQMDGTWLAMQTLNTCNPAHVLWDSWLPLYSLLNVFGLEEEALMISRYRSKSDCPSLNEPLEANFGFPNRTVRHDSMSISGAQSKYVCGRHSLMGIGWLVDHGVSQHGWDASDLTYPVNIGRGPELQRFRARLLRQMEVDDIDPVKLRQLPPQVVFLHESSRHKIRQLDFRKAVQSVKDFIPHAEVSEVNVGFPLTFREMAMIASNASVYVSAVGGATSAAFFLPKDASLILYGDKDMYLDFDLFNNYGHLRVHWLSVASRQNDTRLLNELIHDELKARGRGHL